MDRNELIKALGNAFHSTSAQTTDIDQMPEHPDAYVIKNLATSLAQSDKKDVEIVGRELLAKFNDAVESNDNDRVEYIISVAKELFYRIESVPAEAPNKAMVYMMAIDRIKEL